MVGAKKKSFFSMKKKKKEWGGVSQPLERGGGWEKKEVKSTKPLDREKKKKLVGCSWNSW